MLPGNVDCQKTSSLLCLNYYFLDMDATVLYSDLVFLSRWLRLSHILMNRSGFFSLPVSIDSRSSIPCMGSHFTELDHGQSWTSKPGLPYQVLPMFCWLVSPLQSAWTQSCPLQLSLPLCSPRSQYSLLKVWTQSLSLEGTIFIKRDIFFVYPDNWGICISPKGDLCQGNDTEQHFPNSPQRSTHPKEH